MQTDRNIVLVGFMGTGKTTVGRLLAERLDMTFVDMDDIIVERECRPISQIFETDGESYFRSLERELVRELSRRSGLVIGAGGGIVLNHDNVTDYSATGLVVCLSLPPGTILDRLKQDTSRPLLEGGKKMQKILDILESRRELYAAIPYQIDRSGLDIDQTVERIINLFNVESS